MREESLNPLIGMADAGNDGGWKVCGGGGNGKSWWPKVASDNAACKVLVVVVVVVVGVGVAGTDG